MVEQSFVRVGDGLIVPLEGTDLLEKGLVFELLDVDGLALEEYHLLVTACQLFKVDEGFMDAAIG